MAEFGNAWRSEGDLLEEKKEFKKQELSNDCQEDILSGFEVDIDNKVYHFSYDSEAQTNLQERWQLFQNNMVDSMTITAHKDGDVRLEVDKDAFNKIYLKSVLAKENKIKKLREDLFPLVERAKSEKDLENIHWDVEVLEPEPETVTLSDERTLDKEVNRVESDVVELASSNAITTNELINLIMMGQMGGGLNL